VSSVSTWDAEMADGCVSEFTEQPDWYAVHTRARHEKKVASELLESDISVYLPLVAQVRRWSDRRKIIEMPLFPCYVFLQSSLPPEVRSKVIQAWGVLGFVGAQGHGLPIPGGEIESIRMLLASKVAMAPCPFLKTGQRVRVRGGALNGVEGTLVSNEMRRLVISVSGIHQSLSINIEGYDVEAI
jgi:transcription antitermination factor NusG